MKIKYSTSKSNLELPLFPGDRNPSLEDIEETMNLGQGSEIAEEM